MRMIANRPAAVAAAFSNSCSPTSPGDRVWAAMPEPITTRGEQGRAQELGQQAAWERRCRAHPSATALAWAQTNRTYLMGSPSRGQHQLVGELVGQAGAAHFGCDRLGVVGDPFDTHVELAVV